MSESVRRSLRAGGLVAVPALLAVALAEPLVFPSLGPSAYLLAARPDAPTSAPRRVIQSHALGTAAGLVAYHLLASPATLTALPPARSPALAALAASGTLAVALTTGAMEVADARHAPACATTLIVALGLLTTPVEGIEVVLAVVVLVGCAWAFEVLVDVPSDRLSRRLPGE